MKVTFWTVFAIGLIALGIIIGIFDRFVLAKTGQSIIRIDWLTRDQMIALFSSLSALVAAIAACAAVGIAVWEGLENRHHNRLSVRPRLQITNYNNLTHDYFGIAIRNHGTGPAIIKSFQILIDKKPMILSQIVKDESIPPVISHTYEVDDTILAGANEFVLKLPKDRQTGETLFQMIRFLKRIEIVVTYSSIYEEEFPTLTHNVEEHLKDYNIDNNNQEAIIKQLNELLNKSHEN